MLNGLQYIRRMHDRIGGGQVDEITWNDLQMDEVFIKVNHTKSFIGEQLLYHNLHCNENEFLDDTTEEISSNAKIKNYLISRVGRIGKRQENYYLYEILQDSEMMLIENGFLIYLLQAALVIFGMLALITHSGYIYAVLGINVVINFSFYFMVKQKYEIYLNTLTSFKEMYSVATNLNKNPVIRKYVTNKERQALQNLRGVNRILIGVVSRHRASIAGDLSGLFMDYLYGVLLYDIAIYNIAIKKLAQQKEDISSLMTLIGRLDIAISVEEYRKGLECWCKPTESNYPEMKNMAHPLLANSVRNDFSLKNKVIITGPNAAGKSTFMKAVAINVILGKAIGTCTASEFLMPKIRVMTCMALRDDVQTGESYYYREASYIKRIIEEVAYSKEPLFIVIDEILKGTNTQERIAASKAILEYFADKKVYLLLATHDVELTEVEGYDNYHFDSKIEADEIIFDYKIHMGISSSKNAIALLEYLKYPKEIIRVARSYVDENRRSI